MSLLENSIQLLIEKDGLKLTDNIVIATIHSSHYLLIKVENIGSLIELTFDEYLRLVTVYDLTH